MKCKSHLPHALAKRILLFCLFLSPILGHAESDRQTTINAVLGDESWNELRPNQTISEASETERITTHLQYVIGLLKKETDQLVPEQLQNRRHCLQLLSTYIEDGRFPKNRAYPGQRRPCFIDGDRICAVGYLVAKTAGMPEAQRVNQRYQYEYVHNMKDEGLNRWAKKWGFSLRELAMIQPTYDFEYPTPKFEVDLYFDEKTNKIGLQSKDGNKITSARFDAVSPLMMSSKVAIAQVNAKFGLIDAKGEWQLNPTYDIITERGMFLGGFQTPHLMAYKDKKITLLNHLGKAINGEPLDRVSHAKDNYFVGERNGKWGVLYYDGKTIIPFHFKSIEPYLYVASFAVEGENGHGLFARWGDTLIPPVYDELKFVKKYWFATKDGESQLFDTYGKPSSLKGINECYPYARGYSDHNILCKKKGQYGVVGPNHTWLIKPEYDTIKRHGAYHAVYKGSQLGLCDKEGKLVIPTLYESIEQRGYCFMVSNQGKKGLLNREFKVVIPTEYDSLLHVGYTKEGTTNYHCFAAQSGNGWQLMDDLGTLLLEEELDDVRRLNSAYFLAKKNGDAFLGDYSQRKVQLHPTPQFGSLEQLYGEYICYEKYGKYGLLSVNGAHTNEPYTYVTTATYQEPLKNTQMINGYILAKSKNKYGVIDRHANIVVPFNYLEYRIVPTAIFNAQFIYLRTNEGWFEAYSGGLLKPVSQDEVPPRIDPVE